MSKNAFQKGYEDGNRLNLPQTTINDKPRYIDGYLNGLLDAANRIELCNAKIDAMIKEQAGLNTEDAK
jgi:hypothetical protein